ncbi:MAG TPA: hypothetical protein PLN91_03030 [Rhodanobacteraceae bacterium]|nr:hypothetical protein [Rhodanobacteraceae bacterium]
MTEWNLTCVPDDPRYGRKEQTLIAEVDDGELLLGRRISVSDFPWPLRVTAVERVEPDSDAQSQVLTQ